ncbi:hypothetical protein [Kitasatospora sp. NPDC097691]|uniref:hypothetical protein n=1 Tax=Kitasatospora sp. NPDC097691 TaxID=3157231 RepID=UPI003324B1EE
MTQRRYEYAPPNTLPGLLQRGRGLGATMAAEDPAAAADLVYGCIRWEWRWDTAVDDRHLYLARLVRDLELPLAPVVELLAGDDDARGRAAGVLGLLARGGSTEARDALRAHLPEEEQEAGRREPADVEPPAGQGGQPDVPALLAALERDWVDRTWCGPMRTARGLARAGTEAAGAISLLRRFWLWTPHSHERPAYLEALAALGSAGMAEAYTESLWDCEARARLLGVGHAPDLPRVRDRLVRLRDDPMEDAAVRTAATTRLGGGSAAGSIGGGLE